MTEEKYYVIERFPGSSSVALSWFTAKNEEDYERQVEDIDESPMLGMAIIFPEDEFESLKQKIKEIEVK